MDADRTQLLPVMIYREPMRLIVQVDDSLLGQVLYYWTYYGKPCRYEEGTMKAVKAEEVFMY